MYNLKEKINALDASGFEAFNASCPISANNLFDCANKTQGGITSRLLLYNWDEWKENTLTVDVDGTITAITNASGVQAWDFSVADSGNVVPNVALRAVDGGADGYDHQIDSRGFDITQAGADQISKMRFQKIVAIIERVDGTAKLYGAGVGMRLSDLQFNEGSPDIGGIIQFIATTPANDPPENELPVVIDAGDAASTKALLDGLTTPGI